MEDQGRPISYMALEVGTPVVTASGTEFGTVEHVLQIPELDVFDGLAVKTHHHGLRFVDRDQVADMTTTEVHCTITDDEVDSLPAAQGAARPPPRHGSRRGPVADGPMGPALWAESTGRNSSSRRSLPRGRRPDDRPGAPVAAITATLI